MDHAGWRNADQMAMGYHGREERGLLTSSRAGNGEDGGGVGCQVHEILSLLC